MSIKQPEVTTYQNQQQANMVFAQDFIYGKKPDTIIVGSSMAARMEKSFLPKDIYNISFSGGSALTGLEILRKLDFTPKTIYVETNIIFRSKDKKMIDNLFVPVWWEMKSYIPALQEKYQPLNLFLTKLKGNYGKSIEQKMNEPKNQSIFYASLKLQKESHSKELKNFENELSQLKELLDFYENRGSKIIFFEMPIDKELANLKYSKQQREIIKSNFKYKWLPLPNYEKYQTADSIHLTYKSASEYSKEFLLLIKK